MKNIFAASLFAISCLFFSSTLLAQTAASKDRYKIDLKLMTPKLSLGGESSNLVFVVTVTNLASKPEAFGSSLHYGYKKFHSQDYYLEAVDNNNSKVDIDGEEDLELFFDDQDDTTKNMNRISQKIITGAYNFTPGNYKIRWVYDPVENQRNNPATKVNPIYSNWQALNITE